MTFRAMVFAFFCLSTMPVSAVYAGGGEEKPKEKTPEDLRREELTEIVKKTTTASEEVEVLLDELSSKMKNVSGKAKVGLNKSLALMFQQSASFKERSTKWDGSKRELDAIKVVAGRIEKSHSLIRALHEKHVKKIDKNKKH